MTDSWEFPQSDPLLLLLLLQDGNGNETEDGRPNEATQTGVTYDSYLRSGASFGVGESSRGVGSASLAEVLNLRGYPGWKSLLPAHLRTPVNF